MIIAVNLKLFKLIVVAIMSAKKKAKPTAFKSLKDLAVITSAGFNKRRAFRALSNLNVSARLTLHDFKSSDYASAAVTSRSSTSQSSMNSAMKDYMISFMLTEP